MGDEASAAPTQAAPTELAPADYEAEAAFAWAFDPDDDVPTQRLTPRRITAAGVAVSLVAIAAAGVVALVFLRDRAEPAPVAAPSSSAPVTSLAPITLPPLITSAPPPPSPPPTATVTVTTPAPSTPAPPTPAPPTITDDQIAAYDRQFVANLRADRWAIWDETAIAQGGHRVCAQLQNGATPWAVEQSLVDAGPLSLTEAQSFVVTAMMVYPGCS